ncbi:hypothetical protein [Ponticaulis profundi]|uniref:Uncharacterized protein n=1 Tax=Ponticaulis profundi TaxID=2665222 RepID=A0ABW1SC23_9PROT
MTALLSSVASSVTPYTGRTARHGNVPEGTHGAWQTSAATPIAKSEDSPLLSEAKEGDDSSAVQSDPEVERLSREKNRAREDFERLKEELKLVRKMWAHDPDKLAEQLLRLGGELEKIMKAYQKAQQALAKILGAQGGIGGAMPALPSISTANARPAPTEDAATDDASGPMADTSPSEISETVPTVPGDRPANADMMRGIQAYQKVETMQVRLDDTPFAWELRGDIDFAHGLRGFATELRESFELARKSTLNSPTTDEKAREERFADIAEALGDLESRMFKYVGALQRAMPPAIRISVPVQAG